jgi:hypothetical protein
LSGGVDSYEQPTERLTDYKARKNTIQVSTKTLALKNKIIVMLCGTEIVDVVVRETAARADIKFVFTTRRRESRAKLSRG